MWALIHFPLALCLGSSLACSSQSYYRLAFGHYFNMEQLLSCQLSSPWCTTSLLNLSQGRGWIFLCSLEHWKSFALPCHRLGQGSSKKDGSLWSCINHRGLNAITVRNTYRYCLLSLSPNIFTKLDPFNANYQVRICKKDEWKTLLEAISNTSILFY